MSPHYLVVSEEYGEVVPVLDYGQGPMEYGCDVWEGEAQNKSDAKTLAWAHWRKTHAKCLQNNRADNRHPMSGVKVEGPFPPCGRCGKFNDCQCDPDGDK